MLKFFKPQPFLDSELGELVRARGHWRGSITLADQGAVPLILGGSRSGPDARTVALARELPFQVRRWRSAIEAALFDHYSIVADAVADESTPDHASLPRIDSSGQVWAHVTMVYAAVHLLAGVLTAECGFTTEWDEEHTLGARFQSGRLLELNGSVVAP